MADGSIGAISMAFNLVDNTSQKIDKITNRLNALTEGSKESAKWMQNIISQISKSDMQSSAVTKAIKDLQTLRDRYIDLTKLKDKALKLNPEFDASSLVAEIDKAKRAFASYFKMTSDDRNLILNKKGIVETYGSKNASYNIWQDEMSRMKKASSEVVKETNKANSEVLSAQKAADKKAAAADELYRKQSEDTHKYQILDLKKFVVEYNKIIKGLEHQKLTAPDMDTSRIDHTIKTLRERVAQFEAMLLQMGNKDYSKYLGDYMKKYNLQNVMLPQVSGKYAKFYDKNEWYNTLLQKSEDKARVSNTRLEIAKDMLDYATSAKAANDAMKSLQQTEKERNSQLQYLEKTIRKLSQEEQSLGMKKYSFGTDTSRIDEMRNSLNQLIGSLQRYQSSLQNGGAVFDRSLIVTARKDALSQSMLARQYTNQSQRDVVAMLSNDVGAAGLEKKLISIENRLAEINAMKGQTGVSQSTLQELDAWERKLTDILDTYRMIKSDSTLLNDKVGMARQGSELARAMNSSMRSMNIAKQEVKDYNRSVSEAAQREKEWASAKQSARQSINGYVKLMDQEKARMEQLVGLRNQLIQTTRNARDSGVSAEAIRSSGVGAQIKQLNDLIAQSRAYSQGTGAERVTNGQYAQVSRETREAAQGIRNLDQAQKEASQAGRQTESQLQRLIQQYRQLENASKSAGTAMQSLKDLLYQFAPVYGIQQLVMSVIETGGEIEKQHIALRTIIGDIQQANDLFEGLKGLALQSPFTFGDLTKDVKQLAAYNVETDQLYDTTKRLADIASGLGVSFERIALAYGQVKSRSWLDAKELRQFSYAGVPLLQSLADMYSKTQGKEVSSAQVKSMISNRQVSFEDVQKVLWDMTDEGGKFYNMQMVLSETLLGRYNKLKDAWEIMLSGFAKGDSIVGSSFKKILDFITSLLLNINMVIPVVSSLFAVFAANKLKNFGQTLVDKGTTAEMRKQIILQTKKLMGESKNTAEKVNELILERKITAQEAAQLGLIEKKTVATGRLGATMTGVSNIAKGMWAAIGGGYGLAIAAITAIGTAAYDSYADAKAAASQAEAEMSDKNKSFSEFNASQGGGSALTTLEEKQKKLREYFDFIKENAPYMEADIKLNVYQSGDIDAQLATVRKWTLAMQRASDDAKVLAADIAKASNGDIEDIKEEFGVKNEYYAEIIRLLNNESEKSINSAIANLSKNAKSSSDVVVKQYSELLNNAKDISEKRALIAEFLAKDENDDAKTGYASEFGGAFGSKMLSVLTGGSADANNSIQLSVDKIGHRIEDLLGANLAKVGKDPYYTSLYRNIIASITTGLDDEAKATFNFDLSEYLGISMESVKTQALIDDFVQNIGNIAKEGLTEEEQKISETLAAKIRNGENLSQAETDLVKKLMRRAADDIKTEYPHIEYTLMRLLSSSEFVAKIRLEYSSDLGDYGKAFYNKIIGDIPTPYSGDKQNAIRNKAEEYAKLNDITAAASAAASEWAKAQANAAAGLLSTSSPEYITAKFMNDKLSKYQKKNYTPKKTRTNQRDTVLEAYKERVKVIKELIALYEKYYKLEGKDSANERANKAGREAGIIGKDESWDFTNTRKIYDDLYRHAPTGNQRRNEYRKEVKILANEEDYKEEQKNVESLARAYEEFNSQLQKQYELRESIQKKYGMEFAQSVTNGAEAYTSKNGTSKMKLDVSYEKDLTNQLQSQIEKSKHPEVTVDMALNYDEKELTDKFGEGTAIRKLIEQLRTERQKLQSEANAIVIGEFDKLESNNAKIARIINEFKNEIDKINNDSTATPEQKAAATDIAKTTARRKVIDASDEYAQFKSNPQSISETQFEATRLTLLDQANTELKEGIIDQEQYRSKMEEVTKAVDQRLLAENALAQMLQNGRKASVYSSLLKQMNASGTDSITLTDQKQAKTIGRAVGTVVTRGEAQKGQSDSLQSLESSTKKVCDAFNGLAQVLDPVAKLFETLGNDTWTDILGGAHNAMSAASSVQNVMSMIGSFGGQGSALSSAMSAAGPYGAAAGAALSIASSIFAQHDAALEEQIEQLKEINSTLQDMKDNVQWEFDNTYGKLYSSKSYNSAYTKTLLGKIKSSLGLKSDEDYGYITSKYEEALKAKEEYEKSPSLESRQAYEYAINDVYANLRLSTLISWKGDIEELVKQLKEVGYVSTDGAQDDTIRAYAKAVETGSAFDVQLAELYEERDNYTKMIADEEDKKDSDSSKIQEYKQSYEEAVQAIQDFDKEQANALYGIDFDSYSDSIASALVDAWASGTKSVKAYKDAVNSALKDVVKNVVQQKVIGTYLDDEVSKWLKSFEDKSGVMDEDLYTQLTDIFNGLESKIDEGKTIYDAYEQAAKDAGYDLSDSSSSSMSSSISGVTEDTADLLASYLNAIRADVSINRTMMEKCFNETLPNMDSNISLSLAQLRGIKSTLDAMAYNVESIHDMMNDMTLGNKHMTVVMKKIA